MYFSSGVLRGQQLPVPKGTKGDFCNCKYLGKKKGKEMNKYGLLIDVYYCTGCHSCEVACAQENQLDADQFGIKITEHVLNMKNGKLMIDYVPYVTDLCNLCMQRYADGKRPSCAKHCLAQCITFGTAEELIEEAKNNSKKPMMFLK